MLTDLSDDQLRARDDAKWSQAPQGGLSASVAEMDFALAAPLAAALHEAVDRGSVGYPPPGDRSGVPEALADFAQRRWSWTIDPARVFLVGDVMAGIELTLRTVCADAPVVVPTPAYQPFLDVAALSGRAMVSAPLDPDATSARLDLDRIRAALAAGARTVLLCQPHNPWGRLFRREELEGLRDIVLDHGARVISDEVHAPLVLAPAGHLPYSMVDGTAEHTTTVVSAAKGWNVPGMKCAQVVVGSDPDAAALRALPLVANHGSGPLGVVAARAAYDHGEPWLDAVLARIRANRVLFADLLAAQLPDARMRPLEATYLAWVDARAYGPDPASKALHRGRVRLADGATFGPGGEGHVRVNLATSAERLERIVAAMTTAWVS